HRVWDGGANGWYQMTVPNRRSTTTRAVSSSHKPVHRCTASSHKLSRARAGYQLQPSPEQGQDEQPRRHQPPESYRAPAHGGHRSGEQALQPADDEDRGLVSSLTIARAG